MKINYYSSTAEVLTEIGQRIKALRIAFPATQQELAEATGLSIKTISNLEGGKDDSFATMIEVLRALGQLQTVDLLVPEPGPRPSQIVEYGKVRQRATGKKHRVAEAASGWKWGDEK